jgi:flotillin
MMMKIYFDYIIGIVEGEMRAVLANMAIEEIFNDRKHLQSKVAEFIQEALNKFGCVLYNANVEELNDTAGYFSTMGQKAQEGAISVAKVAIAEGNFHPHMW